MTTIDNSLTDTDIRQISQLIESLDKSGLDFLQVDAGGVKVTISKSGATPAVALSGATAVATTRETPHHAQQPPVAEQPASVAPGPAAVVLPAAAVASAIATRQDGTAAITAPLLGRFYSRPDPAAAPYVMVGSVVDVETPVGLIEVMKLFNTVQAGVSGTICEICVADGEFIEYGTTIFRVRPRDDTGGGNIG